MNLFSYKFWVLKFIGIFLIVLSLWFIPWVFTFYSGIFFYFPYHADGQSRYLRVTGPILGLFSKSWTGEKQIPNACKAALVTSEDNLFYQHNGVDYESLKKSRMQNMRAKKIIRGGSTITQQLVKNAFLSRNKSYLRKVREITGAILLDKIMSKENQIAWYFNIIEFGPELYGIENAAQHYFKISADKLSVSQCLALVAIIPSPKKWNQSLEKRRLTKFFTRRYKTILEKMFIMENLKKPAYIHASSINLWGKSLQPKQVVQVEPPKNVLHKPNNDLEIQDNVSDDSSESESDIQNENDDY